MILIADSSALIALAICDGLPFLDALYGEVFVPEAVHREVTRSDKPEAEKLRAYLLGKVKQADMASYVYLDAYADTGETEAMMLYKQTSADKLLIDDKRGRKIARINNIRTIGSLGVLLSAKRAGLITELGPSLVKLQDSQIFISPSLVATVLEIAGETR